MASLVAVEYFDKYSKLATVGRVNTVWGFSEVVGPPSKPNNRELSTWMLKVQVLLITGFNSKKGAGRIGANMFGF
jgi:hypothetical protein